MKIANLFVVPGVVAFALLAATPAEAADCSTLPSPIYFSASGNHKALLKQASAVLSQAATPVTIVFQSNASCVALDQVVSGTKATNSALYWDAGVETACTVPITGVDPDVAMSDVYASTCNATLPATLKDFLGPIQVMTFVTHPASTETSISADAAYVVLGFGGAPYPVAPWTDPNFLFIRSDTSGTKLLTSKSIGLPVAKWKGLPQATAGDVLTAVSGSTSPNATLGIITTELADAYRQPINGKQLKTLAYQHKGQSCGYFPDSSSTTFDKLNVREGRYPMWGNFHIVAKVDGAGKPTNPFVKQFTDLVNRAGVTEAEKKSMTDAETAAFAVPVCAMKVQRASEMALPTPFAPPEPCGCYFESKTGGAKAGCAMCTDDAQCSGASPKCRFGFCEAR